MKKILILFLTIFYFSFAERTVVLGTDPFPPLHSPEKADYGFFAEIVKESFAIENYKLKIEFVPWLRAMELGKTGFYDGVIGALHSVEREKDFLFSDPVYRYGLVLYTRKELADTKEDFYEMKELKLGQVKGYFYPMKKVFLNKYKIIESTSIENNLNALINKRVDFIIEADIVIDNLLNTSFNKYINYIKGIDVFEEKDFHIMISKKITDTEKVVESFNEGLRKIKANGTYNKILKKYGIKNKYY